MPGGKQGGAPKRQTSPQSGTPGNVTAPAPASPQRVTEVARENTGRWSEYEKDFRTKHAGLSQQQQEVVLRQLQKFHLTTGSDGKYPAELFTSAEVSDVVSQVEKANPDALNAWLGELRSGGTPTGAGATNGAPATSVTPPPAGAPGAPVPSPAGPTITTAQPGTVAPAVATATETPEQRMEKLTTALDSQRKNLAEVEALYKKAKLKEKDSNGAYIYGKPLEDLDPKENKAELARLTPAEQKLRDARIAYNKARVATSKEIYGTGGTDSEKMKNFIDFGLGENERRTSAFAEAKGEKPSRILKAISNTIGRIPPKLRIPLMAAIGTAGAVALSGGAFGVGVGLAIFARRLLGGVAGAAVGGAVGKILFNRSAGKFEEAVSKTGLDLNPKNLDAKLKELDQHIQDKLKRDKHARIAQMVSAGAAGAGTGAWLSFGGGDALLHNFDYSKLNPITAAQGAVSGQELTPLVDTPDAPVPSPVDPYAVGGAEKEWMSGGAPSATDGDAWESPAETSSAAPGADPYNVGGAEKPWVSGAHEPAPASAWTQPTDVPSTGFKPPTDYIVQPGDNDWKILRGVLSHDHRFTELSTAQQNNVIANLEEQVRGNPALVDKIFGHHVDMHSGKIGFADLLHPNDHLNLEPLLHEDNLKSLYDHAHGLGGAAHPSTTPFAIPEPPPHVTPPTHGTGPEIMQQPHDLPTHPIAPAHPDVKVITLPPGTDPHNMLSYLKETIEPGSVEKADAWFADLGFSDFSKITPEVMTNLKAAHVSAVLDHSYGIAGASEEVYTHLQEELKSVAGKLGVSLEELQEKGVTVGDLALLANGTPKAAFA